MRDIPALNVLLVPQRTFNIHGTFLIRKRICSLKGSKSQESLGSI